MFHILLTISRLNVVVGFVLFIDDSGSVKLIVNVCAPLLQEKFAASYHVDKKKVECLP